MKWLKYTTSIVAIASLFALSSEKITSAEENKTSELPNQEINCLAKNVYFEAKNQGTGGWLAVAFVTLNRVKDSRFPNTICEVVHQGPSKPSWQDPKRQIPIRYKCQFSWYCDGKPDIIGSQEKYNNILVFTNLMLGQATTTEMIDITDGATHYHADYVKPAWAKTKTKTIEIGDHIFYRWEK